MAPISLVRTTARLAALAFAATAALAQSDVAGSRDHPLFNRMSGFFIEEYAASDFNSREFLVQRPQGPAEQSVEGRKTEITYRLIEGAKEPSSLQVVRNHENAITQAGGKVLFRDDDPSRRVSTLHLAKGGREIWVEVVGSDGGGYYSLAIVEKAGMAQEIAASEIYDSLAKQGRIALYILFDTGKSTIRPESRPIVAQVAQMMSAHPELAVAVEGHTDNVGAPAPNKELSEQRARAVVAALTAQGVAPGRLTAAGFGQERPVAANANEEGRAKNRRVELVRR